MPHDLCYELCYAVHNTVASPWAGQLISCRSSSLTQVIAVTKAKMIWPALPAPQQDEVHQGAWQIQADMAGAMLLAPLQLLEAVSYNRCIIYAASRLLRP